MIPEERIAVAPKPSSVSRVSGYALLWGEKNGPVANAKGKHIEIFRKGCFVESILRGDVTGTIGFGDDAEVIGCRSDGRVRVVENDVGLWYEMTVPEGVSAEEMLSPASVRIVFQSKLPRGRGDAQGEKWSDGEDGQRVREILDADLVSVGIISKD
ncbi:MAG: HK97 family phage prohead protease [Phycisphaerales bacterium]|nr:HK97 family phage prohead protease [Phycisphaerales bacterium]